MTDRLVPIVQLTCAGAGLLVIVFVFSEIDWWARRRRERRFVTAVRAWMQQPESSRGPRPTP